MFKHYPLSLGERPDNLGATSFGVNASPREAIRKGQLSGSIMEGVRMSGVLTTPGCTA
jgi:hypothetical protein